MHTIALALASLAVAGGPQVSIEPRKVADFGFAFDGCRPGQPSAFDTAETAIAFHAGVAVAVSFGIQSPATDFAAGAYVPCANTGRRVRAAVRRRGTWSADYVDPFHQQSVGLDDPTIAADPVTGNFVIVARKPNSLWQATYAPGFDAFSDWRQIASIGNDKPWLVAGKGRELYLVYEQTSGGAPFAVSWQRSRDGGETWTPPRIAGVGGVQVPAQFCAVPAVHADGPLYVAYKSPAGLGTFRFLVGVDDDVNDDIVFAHVAGADGLPLAADVASWGPLSGNYPAPSCPDSELLDGKFVPGLAVDPSVDPSGASGVRARLYFVHHDIVSGDTDLDVFLRRLEQAQDGSWTISAPLAISDEVDRPGTVSDQFLPTVAVDRFGRVHVLFYDNRAACGRPGGQPAYRWTYALSVDRGQTFTNHPVDTCDQSPSLDYGEPSMCNGFPPSPREYNGIALDESNPARTVVWTSYYGVSQADPSAMKSVIFSARIEVANP
jgi:hypothetical protein